MGAPSDAGTGLRAVGPVCLGTRSAGTGVRAVHVRTHCPLLITIALPEATPERIEPPYAVARAVAKSDLVVAPRDIENRIALDDERRPR
jgi:hypothetical protein